MTVESQEVVILGAGLAGLSAAYHLQAVEAAGPSFGVYEREGQVGGLCRSFQRNGYTVDCTGHLMHFRRPDVKVLVERLMAESGDVLVGHQRRAAIYSHGVFTDYPFQANTFGLPIEVVKECLLGFIEAWRERVHPEQVHREREGRRRTAKNFLDWVGQTFGQGIAKHFMIPFNEKLWLRPLWELSCDWGGGWLIPVPTLEEVVKGALGETNRSMGYNPSFFYPKEGGIQRYPAAFGRRISQLHLRHEVVKIDLRQRIVQFHNGRAVRYRWLISTMPLPELARRSTGLPTAVRQSVGRLAHVSVTNVNLGVARQGLSPYHWVYFPEPRFPFYRVGFPSTLSDAAAPSGHSLLSVEFSHQPGRLPERREAVRLAVDGLKAAGILHADDRLTLQEVIEIPYAYVIFDHRRQRELPKVLRALRQRGVLSIGRYGAWEHSSMEDAVWQGKCAAESIARPRRRAGRRV